MAKLSRDITFDCGHGYSAWEGDIIAIPRVGDVDWCEDCVVEAYPALAATAGRGNTLYDIAKANNICMVKVEEVEDDDDY